MQAERFKVKIIEAEFLLITRSHEDHFCPWLLGWRGMPLGTKLPPEKSAIGVRFSELKTLRIYGNNRVCTNKR